MGKIVIKKTPIPPRFPEAYKAASDVVNKLINTDNHILLVAPPKSGKRIITQYISKIHRRKVSDSDKFKYFYITALNRRDIKSQLKEMLEFHITAYILARKKFAMKFKTELIQLINQGITPVIHLDELDYGSGSSQSLSVIWNSLEIRKNCRFILYSASAEEAQFSKMLAGGNISLVVYEPPPHYRGAAYYYNNDLFRESDEFFNIKWNTPVSIAEQGNKCLELLDQSKISKRYVGVVRVSGGISGSEKGMRMSKYQHVKNDYDLKMFLWKNHRIQIIFVDSKNSVPWDNSSYWGSLSQDRKYLVVINQTGTRSTDFCGVHQYMAFLHDHRNSKTTPYNTYYQAIGRAFHYHPTGQHIYLYCDRLPIQLASKIITYDEFLECRGKLSMRVKNGNNFEPYECKTFNNMSELNYWKLSFCLSSGRKFVKSIIPKKIAEKKWDEDDKSISVEEKFERIKSELTKDNWFKIVPAVRNCDTDDEEKVYLAVAFTQMEDLPASTNDKSMYF
jgi:hypothetical protein